MRDPYEGMDLGAYTGWKENDVILLAAMAVLAALISLSVFTACFYWFLREQRRLQRRLLSSLADGGECCSSHSFLTGKERPVGGELVAQFKVNQGKQVVSLMESDGKRFIHVDGELSGAERARMVRYLKSEGFMS
jgi:hypothetical protein